MQLGGKLTSSGIGILAISLILMIQSANAEVLCWDFTVHPTQELVPMTGVASDAAWPPDNGVYTPYGGTIAGTGLQGDGTAIFADAPTENANSGFVRGGWGAFTLDVRIKVLENVTQGNGKSMSIVDCTGNGRGVKLRTDGMELVSGSGVVRGYGYDGTQWQIIRFSLSCNGTVDVCLWDANASSWITLGNQGLGGSGWNIDGASPGGFAIGSMAGSSTQSGKFQIDWARVDNTQALGCTGGFLPPCSGSCGSGVAPTVVKSVTGFPGGAAAPMAMTNLGSPDYSDGLTVLPNNAGFDGNTEVAVVGGRSCRQNVNPAVDAYIFFDVAAARIFQGSQPDVYITVEYFDTGSGSLDLQYDASGVGQEYKPGGSVGMTGGNVWKRATLHVTDAYFGTRQAWGADFRFGNGGAQVAVDSVIVSHSPGPEVGYTIGNTGTGTINWTAVEANADGTAHDYPWLSLTSTGGSLAAGLNAPVKALIDTTSLAAPPTLLKAYLKFTDDCPLPAAYAEPFTPYSAATLVGQGGWVGSGDTGPFMIEINGGNHELNLNGSGAGESAHSATHSVDMVGKEGVFSVTVKVKQGGYLPDRNLNYFWSFRALDPAGNNYGYWTGTPTTFIARNPITTAGSAPQNLTSDYQVIEMRINTGAKTAEYYVNSLGPVYTPKLHNPHLARAGITRMGLMFSSS